jgi:uncharacterized damage-inducible protein DinB
MASHPSVLKPFYAGWARQQQSLLDSIRPLSLAQMQLRPAPGQWAIWQLCGNMAGGRLYWFCRMLGEDDRGVSQIFKVDHVTVPGVSLEWAGWEDNEDQPRSADEVINAFEKTWEVVEGCLERWTLEDLTREVTAKDAWGQEQTITPAWAISRVIAHEVHHGSEVSLILRVHGLPTQLNR